ELGVGKTVLVAKALRSLEPAPRILHAECAFGSTDVPFATIAEVLRDAAGVNDRASPEEATEVFEHFVHDVLGDARVSDSVLDALRPILLGASVPETTPVDVSDHVRGAVGAIRLLLRALGGRGPLVLWIDALQWADAASLELMTRLLHRGYD